MVRRWTLLDIQTEPFTFDCCANEKSVEVQFETTLLQLEEDPLLDRLKLQIAPIV